MNKKSLPFVAFLVVIFALSGAYSAIKWQQYKMQKWADRNFVVLLTMTIDPAGTIKTRRSDIDTRIKDYRQSMARWAELPYRVIAIESSGYGNPFADILEHASNITYISKKLPHVPMRGKGYGEAHIIRYAVENFLTNEEEYIMKITGRYAPTADLTPIVQLLRTKHPEVMLRDRRHHGHWYVAKRSFNLDFTDVCIQNCDESTGSEYDFDEYLYQTSNRYPVMRVNLSIEVLPTFRGSANDPVYSM